MRKLGVLISGLVISLTLACGGGSGSSAPAAASVTPATGLAYTDPTGTGWRLVKDGSSTDTRLVLNLIGPTGLRSRGVGFNLQAPTTVKFGKFTTGDRVTTDLPIKDTGVYFLLNQTPMDPITYEPLPTNDPLEPKLLAGGVKKGNLLTVGIFQKDRRESAKDSGSALCQIAIEFDAASHLNAGDGIALAVAKAKYMAEDIGGPSFGASYEKVSKAHLVDMTLALGTLRAK